MKYHIGEHIKKELNRQERTVVWLAKKICCSRTNVYKIFEKENLDINLLKQISRVLQHDFFRDISEAEGFNKQDFSEITDES